MSGLHSCGGSMRHMRTRVRSVHSSYLTRSQPVLISSRNSRENTGKLRMSRLVIEATVIYTLVQFSNIISLVLGKLLIFLTALKDLHLLRAFMQLA